MPYWGTEPVVKYITWGLVRDPFKGYPEQFTIWI